MIHVAKVAGRAGAEMRGVAQQRVHLAVVVLHLPVANKLPIAASEHVTLGCVLDSLAKRSVVGLHLEADLVGGNGLAPSVHPMQRRALTRVALEEPKTHIRTVVSTAIYTRTRAARWLTMAHVPWAMSA